MSIESIWRDLRISVRTLRRNPGFAIASFAVLALTIGAVLAMFAFVNAILLRPLPYRDPGSVVMIWETPLNAPPRTSATPAWYDPRQQHVAAANLNDWRSSRAFEEIVPIAYGWFSLPSLEEILGGRAGPRFFDMLGAKAALGRTFTASDAGQRVVVLTHGCWRTRFGSDPSLVGRSIRLGDDEYVVVGVLAPDFFFFLNDFELWVPLELSPRQMADRGARRLLAAGRLKQSVTPAQAGASLNQIARRLSAEHAATNRDWGVTIVPVQQQFTAFLGPILTALFCAVMILLLIGGFNVASLFLARADGRERELSIRLALGASRTRVFRLLWFEALWVTAAAACAGWLMALAILPLLISFLPLKLPIPIPGLASIGLGLESAMVAALLALMASIVITVLSAWRSTSEERVPHMQHLTARSGSAPHARFFRWLTVGQTGMTIVLLAAAGVTVHSMLRLFRLDQGFEVDRIVAFRTPLARERYPSAEAAAAVRERYREAVRRVPGVVAAAIASDSPLGGSGRPLAFEIDGRPAVQPAQLPRAQSNVVEPGYFATLGIPLLRGRDFSSGDHADAPAVVIVSQALASREWDEADVIGKRIRLQGTAPERWMTIVGVTGDVRPAANAPLSPAVYLP
jgi:predicted permease